ncbi:hypothetical protein ACFL03_10985 [Thermodesulfobacteriota bacterium]
MNSEKNGHLDKDQLIVAVIDEKDLPLSLQEHLAACPQCRTDKIRFERKLTQIGRLAKQYAPLPEQKISLPESKPRRSLLRPESWQIAAGTALAVAVVIFAVLWSRPPGIKPEIAIKVTANEMLEAESFMDAISALTENALPAVYLDITGESYIGFDEEFMQFVVPNINERSPSSDLDRKELHHVKV